MIQFEIIGTPIAKQSTRFTKRGIKYTPKKITDYVKLCKVQIKQQLNKDFKVIDKNIAITLDFIFENPKTNKANTELLNLGYVKYKNTRPDIDNLSKSILDVMNNLIYIDDNQIVSLIANKYYGKRAKTLIKIYIENENYFLL